MKYALEIMDHLLWIHGITQGMYLTLNYFASFKDNSEYIFFMKLQDVCPQTQINS